MSSSPPVLRRVLSQPHSRILLVRILMILVVAASATLVWWSTSKRLMPATRQLRDKTLEMARLANEVQQLEMKWNSNEVARIEARFAEAQTRLFDSTDALTGWRQQTEQHAAANGLQPSSQAAPANSQAIAGRTLSRVPVTLELRPLDFARTTNTPYRRLLQFSRVLEHTPKRIDLVDLSISGNSNSVRSARLLLEGWSHGTESGMSAAANAGQAK